MTTEISEFNIDADYTTEFHGAITDLIAEDLPREERMQAVYALTEAYRDIVGAWPEDKALERLADVILSDELRDTDRMKVRNTEYPFMSARQLERRRDGESPLKIAKETGTDGRDYRVPSRRKRSTYELIFVDANARIRNKERAAQYRKDTAVGAVHTYNIKDEPLRPAFVDSADILRRHGVYTADIPTLEGRERVKL
jgi:hypothetical protein